MRPMKPKPVKILYFAWVREKTGKAEEVVELPAEVATVADLVDWLKGRGPEYAEAFARSNVIRAAIDQKHVPPHTGLAGARERRADDSTRRRHHPDDETSNGNRVTGSDHRMLRFGVQSGIRRLQEPVGRFVRLHVRPMVDEMPNRNPRSELGEAAVVVAVPMRCDQVINLRHTARSGGVDDSAGVPRRAHAPVSRIDEQRLTRRRHEERRVTAFYVDNIDVQSLREAGLR